MASNGLNAKEYRDWIDNSIELSDTIVLLFSQFVVGTPAYGLSKKGRDLYSHFGYKELLDYMRLKEYLLDGIEFKCCERYEELKDEILNDELMNFNLEFSQPLVEKIFIFSGKFSDSSFYKDFFKNDEKGKEKEKIPPEKRKIQSQQKKTVVAIDKLFYHIRNALAHGCFSVVKSGDNEYLVLQDEYNNNISARMIIKTETLLKWIEFFQEREKSLFDEQQIKTDL